MPMHREKATTINRLTITRFELLLMYSVFTSNRFKIDPANQCLVGFYLQFVFSSQLFMFQFTQFISLVIWFIVSFNSNNFICLALFFLEKLFRWHVVDIISYIAIPFCFTPITLCIYLASLSIVPIIIAFCYFPFLSVNILII